MKIDDNNVTFRFRFRGVASKAESLRVLIIVRNTTRELTIKEYDEEFDEMLVAGGGGDDSRAGCGKCAEAHNGVGCGVVQD